MAKSCTTFPYQLSALTWDEHHVKNEQDVYCYCGKPCTRDKPMMQCESCHQWFHGGCVHCLPKPLLFGDQFCTFQCSVCTQGPEKYERANMSWVTIVHLVIYNLMRRADIAKDRDHKYFRWKEELCDFVEDYWEYLAPEKAKSITWHNTIASVLSTQSGLFLSGLEKFQQAGWWTLRVEAPPDKNRSKGAPRPRVNATPRISLKNRNAAAAAAVTTSAGRAKRERNTAPSEEDQESVDGGSRKRRKSDKQIDFTSSDDSDTDLNKWILKHNPTSRHSGQRLTLTQPVRDFLTRCCVDITVCVDFEDTFAPEMVLEEQSENEEEEWLRAKVKRARTSEVKKTAEAKREFAEPASLAVHRKPSKKEPTIVSAVMVPHVAKARAKTKANGDVEELDARKLRRMDATVVASGKVRRKDGAPSQPLQSSVPLGLLPSSAVTRSDKERGKEDGAIVLSPTTATKLGRDKSSAGTRLATAATMTPQEEWALLQKLEHTARVMTPRVARFRRKLHVRRLKRNLGLKSFDLDSRITRHLRSAADLEPILPPPTPVPTLEQTRADFERDAALLSLITSTPYASSFVSRLHGRPRLGATITRDEPWVSAYHGRRLRPYIWRDYSYRPARLRLLEEIRARRNEVEGEEGEGEGEGKWPVDYVYFQREHLEQVNEVLCRAFWPGIDVSENLQFPDFSVVAMYRRLVVGCAFMTPEAYVTYIAVLPGWDKAGIGKFMLYHLIQTAIGKDITLHVSANNRAMIMYQKFGFKPEEFVNGFYDKYLPPESVACKNAFFVRLRR